MHVKGKKSCAKYEVGALKNQEIIKQSTVIPVLYLVHANV